MKPYIAILIDSFWEAIGNKVLWALLLAWLFILLALAPFGYVTERSFKLASHDIENRTRLIEKLSKGAKGQGTTEIQAIAKNVDAEFLNRVKSEGEKESTTMRLNDREIAQGLNAVLSKPELYSEEAFPTAHRRERLKPLIENVGSLDATDLEELNRELLRLAFPIELESPRAEQLYIGYAGIKITEPLGISRRQIDQFVEPILLGIIIKLGLGVVAIFVSLIVTSAIIPDTFKTGSLHLLLSKPISRVWLFLSKFCGGCIFVFVNITFLLIGLYLIAGTRFGIWNNGLLACIPLLLFVFIIFYSVSALAGLLWGNPIVCVVACMIFWLFCFGIGFFYESIRPVVEIQQQISRIYPLENQEIVTVNDAGQFNVWNKEYSVWQPAIEAERRGQARMFGPIYDEQRKVLIAKQFFSRGPFQPLQASSRKLAVIHLDKSSDKTFVGTPETTTAGTDATSTAAPSLTNRQTARVNPHWMADPGPELPEQLFDMFAWDDSIIAVCRSGLYQLDMEMLEAAEVAQTGFLGMKLPWLSSTAFRKISPPDLFLDDNTVAARREGGSGIILYSSRNLELLTPADDALVVSASYQFDEAVSDAESPLEDRPTLVSDGSEAALVQMNQNYCVVARDGLPLVLLSSELQVISEIELPDGDKVRQLAWIPGTDRLAIVTHAGQLLQLDCPSGQASQIRNPFSGDCLSMSWLDEKRVWLGVQPNRAFLLDTATNEVETECIPAKTTLESIFTLAVKPLYWVNPKPSALDNSMTYLLSGSQTINPQFMTNDLESAQVKIDIWQPIYSNLAFVALVLGLSCIYVARKEY
jgi:hypothetical protein